MKKKQPKETVLSTLREILTVQNDMRELLGEIRDFTYLSAGKKETIPEVKDNAVTVTFPQLTAKEMIEKYDNKLGDNKILFNPKGWYEKEAFYTLEKPRSGTFKISFELLHKGKSWNECKDLLKEGQSMPNFAECVHLLIHYNDFRNMLENYNWMWTSSHSLERHVVLLGCFDSGGLNVDFVGPYYSHSNLGSCFSLQLKP